MAVIAVCSLSPSCSLSLASYTVFALRRRQTRNDSPCFYYIKHHHLKYIIVGWQLNILKLSQPNGWLARWLTHIDGFAMWQKLWHE